jgi:hypothetical protein
VYSEFVVRPHGVPVSGFDFSEITHASTTAAVTPPCLISSSGLCTLSHDQFVTVRPSGSDSQADSVVNFTSRSLLPPGVYPLPFVEARVSSTRSDRLETLISRCYRRYGHFKGYIFIECSECESQGTHSLDRNPKLGLQPSSINFASLIVGVVAALVPNTIEIL